MNRRRCPGDPLAPERSKQESESWWEAAREPHPGASPPGHSPPRQAWMKNIFGLFCRLGQLALSKSRKTSCSCRREIREKGGLVVSGSPESYTHNSGHPWRHRQREVARPSLSSRGHRPARTWSSLPSTP